jgi:hypothetical protein
VQPNPGFVLNPQRKSNPFALDAGSDWVPKQELNKNRRTGQSAELERKPVLPPRRETLNEFPAKSVQPKMVNDKSPPVVPRKPLSLSSQTKSRTFPIDEQTGHTSWQSSSLTHKTTAGGSTDLLGDAAGEQIEWKPLVPQ